MRELIRVNLLSASVCVCISDVIASIHLSGSGCISVQVTAVSKKKR